MTGHTVTGPEPVVVAAITVVHGRHDHLALQDAGLLRSTRRPDWHVVVAMDDPQIDELRGRAAMPRQVVHLAAEGSGLPLARARNIGAQTAIARGADVLVFLDVDCIPSAALVAAYERAATHPVTCRDLLCGPVTYLPEPPADGYDLDALAGLGEPHAARPAPAAGDVLRDDSSYDLFWSLSFALTPQAWFDVGGFDEAYTGYGGEDTDFARRAEAAGTVLTWVGGADAFHQHHPVSSPPVEHLADIVRNATVFFERWGEWPMRGWLDAFENQGLVRRRSDGMYEVTCAGAELG